MDEILRELDFEEKEINIYKKLVAKKQLCTAYQISKDTGIHRSTVYDTLDKLVRKGFVSTLVQNGKKHYQVNEAYKIISALKEKETLILSLFQEIKNLKDDKEVSVELLEGVEGQRELFFSLFHLGKTGEIKKVHVIGNGDVSTLGSRLYIKRLVSEWKKLKISKQSEYKCIWNESFRGRDIVKQFNPGGEDRFLRGLPSDVTVEIFGDYVAFPFTQDKPYVIRIKNKLVAETFEYYFKTLWELAKP